MNTTRLERIFKASMKGSCTAKIVDPMLQLRVGGGLVPEKSFLEASEANLPRNWESLLRTPVAPNNAKSSS